MKHFDKELQDLADSGYRSTDDWLSLGRQVVVDAAPRTITKHRGQEMPLFTRDQTQAKPRSDRRERAPAAANPVATPK